MSQRRLRDELRNVFDSMSEPAHPALGARIRAELRSAPATGMRTPRLAAAIAVLAAVLIVVSLVLVSRHGPAPSTTPAGPPAATASPVSPAPTETPPATAGPSASPAPTPAQGPTSPPAASPPSGALPPFVCGTQSGTGPTSPPIGVTDVRVGPQSGYDRFVIEFNGPVPAYDVVPKSSAAFFLDPSGQQVTLSGSAGLLVTVHGAQSAGSFTGSTDQKPSGTAVVREARQTGDFEGVVHWGLGLSHASCFRAFTLANPSRLVVDVQG